MQGLYYVLSLAVFGMIVYWFIQNDRLKPGEPTKGFFRMKDETPSEDNKDGKATKTVGDTP